MNEEQNITQLPEGWKLATLRDVCKELQSGKRPKGGVQGIASGIPSIGAEHLDVNGGFKFSKIKFVPNEFANQMKKGIIQKDDIIVVKDGATTGKASYVSDNFPFEFAVVNEHVFIVRVTHEVLPRFAFYKIWSSKGNKEILEDFRGAAQGGISSGFIDKVTIPFPTKATQQTIVSKIEELFSELDKGIENLRLAQQQLKTYRQSVLKCAFEGKLTNENVKEGELPKGWKHVLITDLAEKNKHALKAGPFGSSLKKEFYVKSGYKIYGQEQVISGDASYGDYYINKEKYQELISCKIKPHDILVSLVGTVGKVLLLPENCERGIINPRLIKISLNKEIYLPKFFKYYFESSLVKSFYLGATRGTTMDVLNLGIIKTIPFPFCPIAEQQKIVEEVESRLSVADNMEESITQSLQQAESLRQSMLNKAFEGNLR